LLQGLPAIKRSLEGSLSSFKKLEVTMSKKRSEAAREEGSQPQPREAFGHPVARQKAKDRADDHKPGYEDSRRPAAASARGGKAVGAMVPPRKADKLPKVSLAEKARQRLSKEEDE
jgi:hypothetical protein